VLVAGVLAVLAAGGVVAYTLSSGPKGPRADLLLHKVKYEPLNLTVVERGGLESADNREVTCKVRAGTKTSLLSIKWVIDDGAQVKKDERLVEIDDSALQDQLKAEKILVDQARAAWVAAEQQYKITCSQNESDIAAAAIKIILAKLDLTKYELGDYQAALKDLEGKVKLAQSNLEVQRERVQWAERATSRDYLSDGQYKAELAKHDSLKLDLANFVEQKRVLEKYTYVRETTDKKSQVTEAERALERAKDQAKAKEVQAESDRVTKKSVFDQEQDKYEDIELQIRNCIISAPQDGMVVYYVSEQSRYGSGSSQSIIAQGEPVKEGQKMMRIPDLRHMLVNTKVHEAMISRIQGDVWRPTGFPDVLRATLFMHPDPISRMVTQYAMPDIRERLRDKEMEKIEDGMKATIRVDAFPERALTGHVKTVATVASQQDWSSADVKVYQTMISIDESLEGLKPGMSAEVTIHVESAGEHVLTVPMQAIVGGAELGRTRKLFVLTPEGPRDRDVVVGLSNERVVEIKDGLKEGEEVILNPKVLIGDKAKTRQPVDNERGGPNGEGDGKAKGKSKGKGKPADDGPPGNGGSVPPTRGGLAK
jgi:HlyD family secretion protein